MKRILCNALAVLLLSWALPGQAQQIDSNSQKGTDAQQASFQQDKFNLEDIPHRLIVKFDPQRYKVRLSPEGTLTLNGSEAPDDILSWLTQHQATMEYALGISYEDADRWEEEAINGNKTPGYRPGLSNFYYLDFPGLTSYTKLNELGQSFEALGYLAYQEVLALEIPPPTHDLSPTTPSYEHLQTYLDADPGINMRAGWTKGADGTDVEFGHCEYAVRANHEDLSGGSIQYPTGHTHHPGHTFIEHGTAAAGIVYGQQNGYGMTGCVHNIDKYTFYTEQKTGQTRNRPLSVSMAINGARVGDVVMLEMQDFVWQGSVSYYGPAETRRTIFDLCKAGTDAGKIIVAAAGNGEVSGPRDLNMDLLTGYKSWGHSGAIIVGAGTPNTNHSKYSYSSYGSRVDLQGWGGSVFTLGYRGYAWLNQDDKQSYTSSFSGTSSATPIVASAVVACQSYAKQTLGKTLTAKEIRDALVATGYPQDINDTKHIGPLPDVGKALDYLLEQDTYYDLGESGVVNLPQPDDTTWHTIPLSRKYHDPIIVMGPGYGADPDPFTIRVKHVTDSSFKYQIDEWDYQDGAHGQEVIAYMVMEKGLNMLKGGHWIYADKMPLDTNWWPVTLYDENSVVLSQTVTVNEPTAVNIRTHWPAPGRCYLRLQEEQATGTTTPHAPETVHYITISQGAHTGSSINDFAYEADRISNGVTDQWQTRYWNLAGTFSQPPLILAKMQSTNDKDPAYIDLQNVFQAGADFRIQEEQSADMETQHGEEIIGYFLISEPGKIRGSYLKKGFSTNPFKDLAEQYKVKVWPNPAQDQINVYMRHNLEHTGTMQIQLMNLNGQILQEKEWQETSAINSTLDLGQLGKGMYFIQFRMNGETVKTEKVLKQ